MEWKRLRALTVTTLAAGLVALGGGCMTPNADKTQVKKPDVTQPGVLPSPQEAMMGVTKGSASGVIPAGGTQPADPSATPTKAATLTPIGGKQLLTKLTTRMEKKTPATEIAVAWRTHIERLPDPSRSGAMGTGLAGQLYLFGGRKLEFVEPDGTLTVDLIDVTPRTNGQPPATPERWHFNKEMLKRLRANDETFGKSYVLFLPWLAYRPDITKVRISARYDSENGQTLFAIPSDVSLNSHAPIWDGMVKSEPIGGETSRDPWLGGPPPPNGMMPNGMMPNMMTSGGMMPAPQPFGSTTFPSSPMPQMQPQQMTPIPLSQPGPANATPGVLPFSPAAPSTPSMALPMASPNTQPLAPEAPIAPGPLSSTAPGAPVTPFMPGASMSVPMAPAAMAGTPMPGVAPPGAPMPGMVMPGVAPAGAFMPGVAPPGAVVPSMGTATLPLTPIAPINPSSNGIVSPTTPQGLPPIGFTINR